jgi:hypothetical protein
MRVTSNSLHQEDDVHALTDALGVPQLVVHELHQAPLGDHDLGREVLRHDLGELLRPQLVDQVLSRELSHIADAR